MENNGTLLQALRDVPGDVKEALLDQVAYVDYAMVRVGGVTHHLLKQSGVWWYNTGDKPCLTTPEGRGTLLM